MVSHVADTLFNGLIDAFPPDRPYGRDVYSRDPMPGPIADHLDGSMQIRLAAATQARDRWFDADHPEIQRASRAYREVLSRHQRIPADDWSEALRNACRETTAYLVRPVRTLPDLIFEGGAATAGTDDIFARLDQLPAYPYFREVIEAYFTRKNVDTIDRARFENLVRRIDRQMTGDYDGDDWVKLLQPLLSVVSQTPEFSRRIPVDVLKAFFAEKDAGDVVARLDSRYVSRGYRSVEESDLHDLFVDQPGAADLVAPADVPIGEHRAASSFKTHDDSVQSPQGDGPLPLWKQFEKNVDISAGSVSQRSSDREVNTGASAPASGQPLWKKFRSDPEAAPREGAVAEQVDRARRGESRGRDHPGGRMAPADDLAALERTVLGERGRRNRHLFVTNLFDGSEDDYEWTLRELAKASTWSEASQIIAREVFKKHQVNIYSGPAVAFTDAAEAQYGS